MSGQEMVRRQIDRRALTAMGRTAVHNRVYDVDVRWDAALGDVTRLPVDANAVVALQDEQGRFRFLSGMSPVSDGVR